MKTTTYTKRLIEVDMPTQVIGTLVRKTEKRFPVPRGHLSTMHAWWARRPHGACRAVILASLWPDPCDPNCPKEFIDEVSKAVHELADDVLSSRVLSDLVSKKTWDHLSYLRNTKDRQAANNSDHQEGLRKALLNFIADFSSWKAGNNPRFINFARDVVRISHKIISPESGARPVVVDPFSGGGTFPAEASKIGAEVLASDLNPIAILINKVALEYAPRYGSRLIEQFAESSQIIHANAVCQLNPLYPQYTESVPVAYLWARVARCEGPDCGAEIPLLRSLTVGNKGETRFGLTVEIDKASKNITFKVIQNPTRGSVGAGTVRRGSATCPICGYTTPAVNVRGQFENRCGGANDARLISVVEMTGSRMGFREPVSSDFAGLDEAREQYNKFNELAVEGLPLLPDEPLPYLRSIFNINLLGVKRWQDLFNYRQASAVCTYILLIRNTAEELSKKYPDDPEFVTAVVTCLAMSLDKVIDYNASLCQWRPSNLDVGHVFGRQAMGIVWDFVETNVTTTKYVDWTRACDHFTKALSVLSQVAESEASVVQSSAVSQILPDDSVDLYVTDPPYYDMVPYADLSDFFYVWLKRSIGSRHFIMFEEELTPKRQEIVQLAERNRMYSYKTKENYEKLMGEAMSVMRRCLKPEGLAVVVFAHKSTDTWEIQLQAMLDAGWIIVGSWPIDTEMGSRLRAQNSAVLASSVHLICRPRENPDGSLRADEVGDWRDVLGELPRRIHDWMPRLAEEGVVGADAIFACLGPALEIFSRYSRVEKAGGDDVTLKEYLEQVWAAVAKEALSLVFAGADTASFEPDARLTAMWLWTLNAGETAEAASQEDGDSDAADDEDSAGRSKLKGGFTLEYDAARKIAQGLGAHLEELSHLVEIKGDQARLLPVAERTKHLFGKEEAQAPTRGRGKKKPVQGDLFADLKEVEQEAGWGVAGAPKAGETVLDRIHQSMILFAAGRGEALKRFLVEEGAGRDQRFWSLAQALSALYPPSTDEKRWVDGVLARKKSLGF